MTAATGTLTPVESGFVCGADARVLVAIASYGTKNHAHLQRLLDEYRGMSLSVDLVVLTEAPRRFGSGVEVRVGLPSDDRRSLPFAHRKLFAERMDSYDVFVYSEDDTLLTQRNIEAFLEVADLLPEHLVPGFMRYERYPDGRRSYSSVHSCFHWDPGSVIRYGSELFAAFTNPHSACYLLTQAQLKRAIESGGFLVEPHRGETDLLVTAATDPYTQCELSRLICVSRMEDFLLHHLSDAYLGRLGLDGEGFAAQLGALASLAAGDLPNGQLVSPTSNRYGLIWNKKLYGRGDPGLERLVPSDATSVLTVGCGSGDTELAAVPPGARLVGVPIDSVMGAVARQRGLEVLEPDLDRALERLAGDYFDCVLLADVLQRFDDPVAVLRRLRPLVHPGGTVVVSVPNVPVRRLRQLVREPWTREGGPTARDGHGTSPRRVGQWLRQAGFRPQERVATFGATVGPALSRLPGWVSRHFGETVTVRATADEGANAPSRHATGQDETSPRHSWRVGSGCQPPSAPSDTAPAGSGASD